MASVRVAVVGGGLSGLYAAYRLTQLGIDDFAVIEAKPAYGGRILSWEALDRSTPHVPDAPYTPENRFDLGPTWFWPEYQQQLAQLIADLDLSSFAQHESGDMLIEQAGASPVRRKGYPNVPTSMRLLGGMRALTDALVSRIDAGKLHFGEAVTRIRTNERGIDVEVSDAAGRRTTIDAEFVLLAVPPRMATSRIEFDPPLPSTLASAWQRMPTWMAQHAKYLAVYETAFWREAGLSGQARSGRGPLVEIHDAGQPDGPGALFGFVGVPAEVRATLPEDALLSLCQAQLVRLFGPQAANPVAHVIKDWSTDAYVATAEDLRDSGAHASAPAFRPATGPWERRLCGIASEWSPRFPGYVAGAIDATENGIRLLRSAIL